MRRVFISGRGAITPAGLNLSANWETLFQGGSLVVDENGFPVVRLPSKALQRLEALAGEKEFKNYDRAALLGVLAAEQAVFESGGDPKDWAVVFGSSRGAAESLEAAYARFSEDGKLKPATSPMTTIGSFAASVSKRLHATGLSVTLSSACSTSLHAIGMAYIYLKSGYAKGAVAGGAEMALTPFTLNMLEATQVYAKRRNELFPCKPFHAERSGLILGEGAACVALEVEPRNLPFAVISGYGAATEEATLTGISKEGEALQRAIRMALADAKLEPKDIGMIIGHGSGTIKGDEAELGALHAIFKREKVPAIAAHKWLTGHMLGAAGAFSVAMGTAHLNFGKVHAHPYFENDSWSKTVDLDNAQHALVIALGFGGNAAAMVLSAI